jgi:hypothetical protein
MTTLSASFGFRRFPAWLRSPSFWTVLAGLALTVFLYSPVTTVMDTQLDSSNYASYTYFAAHHFQYGPEVVPMSGPYGYVLYGSVYNGLLFWTRLIAQLLCAGAFATLILWFFHQCRDSRWRWLWLLLILLLSPVIEDLPFEWMIFLSGILLLQRAPKAPGTFCAILAASLLAFISLIKGTHLVLSVATLGLVFLNHAWLKNWRRAFLVTGSYAAAFLFFWLLAGQRPQNIPSFISGIRALTNGYNGAMALDEIPSTFYHGIFALISLAVALAWGLWHQRKNDTIPVVTLLFAGFTFVKWKHGFVRADGHVYIFHHYVTVACVFWMLYAFTFGGRSASQPARRTAIGLMIIGLVAGLWVENAKTSVLRLHWLATTWSVDHLKTNVAQLLHPLRAKAELDRQLALQRDTYAMPLTKQDVGDHSIDLFGLQHGIIPLNEMNYRPRPMGGGAFNAYNSYLMGLNQAFLRNASLRPDYYLLRFETIDNRLATEDDGLTLLELLHRYEPLRIEQGHVLMKVVPDAIEPELRPLSRRTFKFGEFVPVPRVSNDDLLVARFDVRPTLKGRIRSALYKAPLMFITLQGRGIEEPESRRFIPSMTASPFLFSPVIENNGDLAYLYTKREGKQLTGFFIYCGESDCYAQDLGVQFFTMKRPTVPDGRDIDELLTFTRFPIANVLPESIVPAQQQISLRGLLVQKLHAPGAISWKLEGTESEFIFDYGFIPEAYERGASNGVVFIVELHPPEGPPEVLFKKLLDPAKVPKDRGNQTARVPLPIVKPGSHLILRTDPGEYGDNAWDWSYVTRMQLKRGRFSAQQFPVFNRVPESIDAEHTATLELEGKKVFLLHVPGSINFGLTGTEHHLYLEFGFMPGAYTGDGHTDGADYVVELVRPNQPRQEIFRHTLRPMTVEGDRGRQSAEIVLPAVKSGDKLVVRTGVVEGGNNSWGWTYLSRVTID